MADAVPNYEGRQEFWKPVGFRRVESETGEAIDRACPRCGGDLIVGAQFCHICGAGRPPIIVQSTWRDVPSWRSLAVIRETLGQSLATLVALVLGLGCLVAALLTGLIFKATTLLDWQAVQLWRIEWLLAAIACLAVGILLKKVQD
jgi:hypothetical protein